MDKRPIGIFDSGVGGLTVLDAVRRRLPAERLIYFGDTAHLPYGAKSKEAVTRAALEIGRFLSGMGIKMLVVACNSASSLALRALKSALDVPVTGVIRPGALAAAKATRNGIVGVIGTQATISSGAYEKALSKIDPGLKVVSKACPLLVPLVEEGWWNNEISRKTVRIYLEPLKRKGLDTLILGCTHYPILKPVICKAVGLNINLVDSAEATAVEVERILNELGIARGAVPAARGARCTWGASPRDGARGPRSTGGAKGGAVPRRGTVKNHQFWASDAPDRFRMLARRMLGIGVDKVHIKRFEYLM